MYRSHHMITVILILQCFKLKSCGSYYLISLILLRNLFAYIVTYPSSDSKNSNQVMLIKALMAAYDILLEDLRRISTGIGKAIDLTEIPFESDATEWFAPTPPACVKSVDGEPSLQLSVAQVISPEVSNSANLNILLFVLASLCFRLFTDLQLPSFPKTEVCLLHQ